MGTLKYIATPVTGYRDGVIEVHATPVRVRTPNPDGKSSPLHDVVNDWFEVDGIFYNVHPYRTDLNGFPVRWSQKDAPDGWPKAAEVE